MKIITILVLDGVMDSSFAITLDALHAAQAFLSVQGNTLQIQTLAASAYITTGCGLRMKVDVNFKTWQQQSGWIIIPGLGLRSDQEITQRLGRRDAVQAMQWLMDVDLNKVKIGASCSSVFLLAESGLLNQRKVTTTWWLAPIFRARYPVVQLDESKMLVSDGVIYTAGAALSQMDLMLAVIADVMGQSIAHLCARYLLMDQRSSQARYMMQSHLLHQDKTVIDAERWVDAHLADSPTVHALSDALLISAKTLARRIQAATGLSPIKFIQRRRLSRAAHLIETSTLSIEEIAAQIGYCDSTALRKLIKREFGMTPSALR